MSDASVFVAVGTQLGFDRLIRAVDAWATERRRDDVFAQIGPGAYTPTALHYARTVTPAEFERRVGEASVVVAHAGMGTILTALCLAKPIVILPRRAELGEQRNEHQLATARRFDGIGGVRAAASEAELPALLDRAIGIESEALDRHAPERLVRTLREFIHAH